MNDEKSNTIIEADDVSPDLLQTLERNRKFSDTNNNDLSTCMMTESVSKTNIPDEMNKGKNIPVQEAIAARAPPKANDPVSPMNIDALYWFWKRKPTHAPAIDAPNMDRSEICGHILQVKYNFAC